MARNVTVRLDADVTNFVAGMRKAKQETRDLATRTGVSVKEASAAQKGLQRSARDSQAAMTRLGDGASRAGLVGAAGLGAIGKAAMDWESAWAGVTKTADFSNKAFGTAEEQSARLEGQLRQLAKTAPTSHAEIAAVAEAAGALGVKTPNIAKFTETMVQLGDTTNLSADEAATSLAQLMNVMGTAPDKVSNLGSALVYLGNNGASTEKQILELGQRAAAAGNQIGLSEADVLGFASAIASTGMNVEAGGTAISTTFGKIDKAVRSGGDALETVSATAGVSAEEFQRAFETDAAGAVNMLVEGLGRITASGGSASEALVDMGIKGRYEQDTLLRLAGASQGAGNAVGLLGDQLRLSGEGFDQNTALAEEAAKRYQTTASRIKISWNRIKDASIEAGGAVLPIIAGIAEKVSAMAAKFGAAPAPVQRAAVALVGIGTAGALAVGGTIKAVNGVRDLADAAGALSARGPKAARAISAIGRAGGVAAIAIGGLAVVGAIDKKFNEQFTPTLQDANKALLDLAGAAPVDLNAKFKFTEQDDLNGLLNGDIDGINDALNRLGESRFGDRIGEQMDRFTGNTSAATTKAKAMFASLDEGFNSLLAAGQADKAGAAFRRMADEVRAGGGDLKALVDQFPQYKSQVESVAEANGNVVTNTDQLVALMSGELPAGFKASTAAADGTSTAVGKVGDKAKGAGDDAKAAAVDIDKLTKALTESGNAALAASGSQRAVQGAINAANRASKEYVQAVRSRAEEEARAAGKSEKAVERAGDAAERQAEQAIRTGAAFRGTTDESLALAESLDNVASASLSNLEAMVNNGAGAEEVSAANEKARGEFLRVARVMGVGTKQAQRMAEEYFGLGRINATPKITAPSDAALKKARLTKAAFDRLPKETKAKILALYNDGKRKEADRLLSELGRKVVRPEIKVKSNAGAIARESRRSIATVKGKTVDVVVRRVTPHDSSAADHIDRRPRAQGGLVRRSTGGGVWGAGTTTSDSIQAQLSNNEFVQRAAAVDRYGVRFMRALNNLQVDPKDLPRFAGGGLAGSTRDVLTHTYATSFQAPRAALQGAEAIARAITALAQRKNGEVNIYVTNPVAEAVSQTIAAAAGYLAAR